MVQIEEQGDTGVTVNFLCQTKCGKFWRLSLYGLPASFMISKYHADAEFRQQVNLGMTNMDLPDGKGYNKYPAEHVAATDFDEGYIERKVVLLNMQEWCHVFGRPQRTKDVEAVETMAVFRDSPQAADDPPTEVTWMYRWHPNLAGFRSFVKKTGHRVA